jgi:hypothetical protein
MPRDASASAVPGPIAATRTPASARASRLLAPRPRSKKCTTPLAEVNTTHAKASRSGSANSSGSTAIDGSSSTCAPRSSNRARSSLACSRARVTTTHRPNNGRDSNQLKSSAATAPITMADGASTPAAAIVASVARTLCCSGRVPHRTAATGVVGASPPATSSRAMSGNRPAPINTTSVPPARARARQSTSVVPFVGSSCPVTTVTCVETVRWVTGIPA